MPICNYPNFAASLCTTPHLHNFAPNFTTQCTRWLVFTSDSGKKKPSIHNSKCERVLAVNWKIFENTPTELMNIISFQ